MSKSAQVDIPSPQRALSGILNVDKPTGLTSHDVVVAVRRLSGQRKVGHAGTLDPMATGVLLVCLGRATRVSEYLMASPKAYRAAVCLGVSTTTHDAEGEVVRETKVDVTRAEVEAALRQFVGEIDQTPPMYSAVKHDGKRLYKLARQGITVQVSPRKVSISRVCIAAWTPPVAHLAVECGPGTYIRALARDLGTALGCGAHVASLRRTLSGQFTVDQAVTLKQLKEAFVGGNQAEILHPLDAAFYHLPALYLNAEMARRVAMGQYVDQTENAVQGAQARAYAPGGYFVAIVSLDPRRGIWRPRKVFARSDEIPSAQPVDVP
jgi:tRNA pseudouridine55 synthase